MDGFLNGFADELEKLAGSGSGDMKGPIRTPEREKFVYHKPSKTHLEVPPIRAPKKGEGLGKPVVEGPKSVRVKNQERSSFDPYLARIRGTANKPSGAKRYPPNHPTVRGLISQGPAFAGSPKSVEGGGRVRTQSFKRTPRAESPKSGPLFQALSRRPSNTPVKAPPKKRFTQATNGGGVSGAIKDEWYRNRRNARAVMDYTASRFGANPVGRSVQQFELPKGRPGYQVARDFFTNRGRNEIANRRAIGTALSSAVKKGKSLSNRAELYLKSKTSPSSLREDLASQFGYTTKK